MKDDISRKFLHNGSNGSKELTCLDSPIVPVVVVLRGTVALHWLQSNRGSFNSFYAK